MAIQPDRALRRIRGCPRCVILARTVARPAGALRLIVPPRLEAAIVITPRLEAAIVITPRLEAAIVITPRLEAAVAITLRNAAARTRIARTGFRSALGHSIGRALRTRLLRLPGSAAWHPVGTPPVGTPPVGTPPVGT